MNGVPERIGPFSIDRKIGEGSFGSVFVGYAVDGLDRDVAIKLLRPGRDSARARARFAAEQQAMARMQHDYIARIFEHGETDDGAAYFAMECVDGQRITAAAAALPLAEKLHLFEKVCIAVQHAHQKGVIHRDLKPSNILVATIDGVATPKLIDFGIARAEDRLLVEDGMPTFDGEVLGTLAYMSPEQAQGRQLEVDTRSDVHALGVVLYEILTGTLPFAVDGGAGGTRPHVLDRRDGVDPVPPSAHAPNLPTDLDWITMRALAYEPARRYQTAAALADDLDRFLHDQPVDAGPPSARYRLGKFLRRNRGPVVAATLVALAIAAGLTAAWLSARRAADNLARFELLAAVISLEELEADERELRPAWPERTPAFRAWLEQRAEPLAAKLPQIRTMLAELRERARPGDTPDARRYAAAADEYLDDALTRLEADLAAFVDPARGLLADVRRRAAWSRTVEARSIATAEERWREAADAIAADPRYRGLRLPPQLGLVPLGADPDSGLQEFAHLRSAADPEAVPARDEHGRLPHDADSGIVFVLLPGGPITIGAQTEDPDRPHYDPMARPNEQPPRSIALRPFFLAKTELTQAQWRRLGRGDDPSYLDATARLGDFPGGDDHPVEQVSWTACVDLLARDALRLPTELEWEYACRAGTQTPWCFGSDPSDLEGTGNFADRTAKSRYTNWHAVPWSDGYVLHAPVATFRQNAFGLHDMLGNVWEWCGDAFDVEVRAVRGGSFVNAPAACRSSYRGGFPLDRRNNDLGVRAARGVVGGAD